jgi:ribokinase
VDATGAGDAFAAGFIYGVLKGKSLEKCGRLGEITAFFSTSRLGARVGFPALKELARRYQKLYSQRL